jgi:hypothetical protein
MASAAITWTPGGGGNVTSQEVQYRIQGTTSWTTAVSGLSASASSYTITGLTNNTIYEIRVASICSVGGTTYSATMTGISWFCPTVSVTPTNNTITYNFSALSGSISGYTVDLLNSAQNTIIQTLTTISGVFNSVSIAPSTQYYVRLTLAAGGLSHACTPVSTTTLAAPTCAIPTGVSASFS